MHCAIVYQFLKMRSWGGSEQVCLSNWFQNKNNTTDKNLTFPDNLEPYILFCNQGIPPLQSDLVLHLLFISELYTYHYFMSSLLLTIKHLEQTFPETSIINDSKNVSAQFSGHLFIFSIRTLQIENSPSILDKNPNKVILGQTQRSITTAYMINLFKGGPWK